MQVNKSIVLGIFSALVLSSCSEDENPNPSVSYEIPTTYSFENVNYSGQSTRLDMMGEFEAEMKKGNSGEVVDAAKLKDMFANQNAPFSSTALNENSKKLKDKTFEADQTLFEGYMDKLGLASQSEVAGANGVAGIVTSNDGTKSYLFDEKGVEYTQVIIKGLMGATFYYQATGSYLTDDKIGEAVDNNTVTEGQGTKMEHHWDEAFGYFGVPTDFPASKEGIRYWGNYSDKVNGVIGSNEAIMNAFIKGRAAISNNDMATKDLQVAIVKSEWEKLVAAAAIHELNAAKANFGDDAIRNHLLSEAIGFVMALKYNPDRKITPEGIDEILVHIGDNLYESDLEGIDNAINAISSVYGFDSVKANL